MSALRVSTSVEPINDVRKRQDLIKKVRAEFFDHGVNIQKWAKARGVRPALVYSILRGERRCARGESHRIAVELGLKHAGQNATAERRFHRQNVEAR